MQKLLKIDPSNIGDHHYLKEKHKCYFFYEYTAKKGYSFSPGNQFISNLKKPVERRALPDYVYKENAIAEGAMLLHGVLRRNASKLRDATVCPIPPSKIVGDAEYDDRMSQIVERGCTDTVAAARNLIVQTESYASSHRQANGERLSPEELLANYRLAKKTTSSTIVLVDDVITTGAHFVAARRLILGRYPDAKVVGIFLARRVIPNPFDDFDAL